MAYTPAAVVSGRWLQLRWRLTGDGTALLRLDHLCWSAHAPVSERKLLDMDTANWAGSLAGGREVPVDLSVVTDVQITLQSVGAGWNWSHDNKNDPTRIKIFDGAGDPADALVDVVIRGVVEHKEATSMPWPVDDLLTDQLDSAQDTSPRSEFLKLFERVKTIIGARGTADGVASLNADGIVPGAQIGRGTANGVASLAADGRVPSDQLRSTLPIGTVVDYAGANAPADWLARDGRASSRAQNAALFAAIGTTWGVGDGATIFNIPDLRRSATIGAGGARPGGSDGPAPQLGETGGAETHTLDVDEMPAHVHQATRAREADNINSGSTFVGHSQASGTLTTQSTGSDATHNNMPPSAVVNKIIKVA